MADDAVWVANRNNPIPDIYSKLIIDENGKLSILSGAGTVLDLCTPTSVARKASVTLLDTGNLVLRELHPNGSVKGVLWQSFDYPTDTLLPGMKLGVNLKTGHRWSLTSWRSELLPANGSCTITGDLNGTSQLVILRRGNIHWRSGRWQNGQFENTNLQSSGPDVHLYYISNENEQSFTYLTKSYDLFLALRMYPDCHLWAYAATKNRAGCKTYGRMIYGARNYNHTEYYAISAVGSYQAEIERSWNEYQNRSTKWIWLMIGVGSLATLLSCYLVYKKYHVRGDAKKIQKLFLQKLRRFYNDLQTDNMNNELRYFTFQSISSATNDFSITNKLGEGGFGAVYKGKLVDGQEVAVKRLSRSSTQGVKEFKNETELIVKLQHTNLVRLLGCCIEKQEKILAEVIHRDLKASNILLDDYLKPKIADFGMAKLFGINESEANTSRVVGTRGYMPPEYMREGTVSIKTDVFSFGVLLLEIVSGKKNHGSYDVEHPLNLLGLAWELWNEGRGLELMDPVLEDSYSPKEVLTCIHVGLLCVQDHAIDRPTMSEVVSLLTNENMNLSDPKRPAFFIERHDAEAARDDKQGNGSFNPQRLNHELNETLRIIPCLLPLHIGGFLMKNKGLITSNTNHWLVKEKPKSLSLNSATSPTGNDIDTPVNIKIRKMASHKKSRMIESEFVVFDGNPPVGEDGGPWMSIDRPNCSLSEYEPNKLK
ncbi:hypothetical protein OSB04_005266 [Centaurea solstitialis]|uniref:Receptor-like serine/threonine-protein kinase n=1 Tax=Centaurea solstitialis TaxID=347529 RepID=A0AA38WS04_9ASTR|nr:hypothetical protein OSB04_005266 [Centaurea solstitialis]